MRRLTPALSHRNYRLFFAGQLVSLTGTWMQSVAQGWLVYRLTGSPAMLGLTAFAGQVPVFLFAPIGGAVADRAGRHSIIVTTQVVAMVLAALLATLTFTERVAMWHVLLIASLGGIVNAFDVPARQAFLMDMVGRADLQNAIALNSSMVNGARMIGPAVAGLVLTAVGEGWCFLLNALSYLAVIGGLLRMQVPATDRAPSSASAALDIVEGFRFVLRTPAVRSLLMVLGFSSVMGAPYTALMPVFAGEILHGGPRGLGVLMAATGVGALVGALCLAGRRGLDGLERWTATAMAGFGGALLLFSQSTGFWLSVALLVPTGAAFLVLMGSANTLIQSMVPDRLRGRVMAIYSMMFMGMAPFGALFAGAVAARIGAPSTVAAGALGCIVASAAFVVRLPALRDGLRVPACEVEVEAST